MQMGVCVEISLYMQGMLVIFQMELFLIIKSLIYMMVLFVQILMVVHAGDILFIYILFVPSLMRNKLMC